MATTGRRYASLALVVVACTPAASVSVGSPVRQSVSRPATPPPAAPQDRADEPRAPAPAEDLRLPKAPGRVLGTHQALQVHVSRTSISVGGAKVLELLPLEDQGRVGAGAGAKRNGPNDLYIVPLGALFEQPKNQLPSAVVYADASVPYRLLVEVLFTLAQNGVGRLLLATDDPAPLAAGQVHGFQLSLPNDEGAAAYVLYLVNFGIAVKLLGENVAEGCQSNAPGVAVPRQGGAQDFAGLRACMTLLKPRAELATQKFVVNPDRAGLVGNPSTPYEDFVGALQALHDSGIDLVAFMVPR